MTNHHQMGLRKLRFDINFQCASTDAGQGDLRHALLWSGSHFFWRAEANKTRLPILQCLLRLTLDGWLGTAPADPTREGTTLSNNGFCAHLCRGWFLSANHCRNRKRIP